jgi:hypothetical protein
MPFAPDKKKKERETGGDGMPRILRSARAGAAVLLQGRQMSCAYGRRGAQSSARTAAGE